MTVNIFDTANRYNLIYADPPWKQSRGGKKSVRANSSGKPLEYPVCSLSEIKEHLKQADSLAEGDTIRNFRKHTDFACVDVRAVARSALLLKKKAGSRGKWRM